LPCPRPSTCSTSFSGELSSLPPSSRTTRMLTPDDLLLQVRPPGAPDGNRSDGPSLLCARQGRVVLRIQGLMHRQREKNPSLRPTPASSPFLPVLSPSPLLLHPLPSITSSSTPPSRLLPPHTGPSPFC
jgi:hypothetical protein